MSLILKVVMLRENAVIPKYMTSGAAGFDFYSVEKVTVNPGETVVVHTGLAMEVPEGYELQIRPRSGLSANTKIRVANSPGTVDSDYRGEIKIIIDNIGTKNYDIQIGDRIAQGVMCKVPIAEFIVVKYEDMEKTVRSDKGLGHSGK